MWNQWSAGPPPMPPTTGNPQTPLIGPIQPNSALPSSDAAPPPTGVPAVQSGGYPSSSGAPSYTPAQYAAMTPEQQFAVQQHWQQWQAYEQQYAQWHAQYGEQYKREMAAIHGAPPSAIPPYGSTQPPVTNSYAYPPPHVSNPYQVPPAPVSAPPPPPPDDGPSSMGVNAPPQIYEQPPPPPPPPQKEDNHENKSSVPLQIQGVPPVQGTHAQTSQFTQNQDSRWSQPPPSMQNQGSRWNESKPVGGQQDRQFNAQFNNNQRGNQNQQNQPWDQQRDDQERDNRQGNRQNNDFRGRNRSRGNNNNNFDNRQQHFDDSEGRNHRQQQSWQRSDSPQQRQNRGNFNNRSDNYDNYSNNNMGGQRNGQQGSAGWNNSSQGNPFSAPDNQRQQQNPQNPSAPVGNTQNNAKTSSGNVDEKAFDEQFRLWEEQFENWKKENANHPDRTMYMQYEREFEKTRIRLLERREQMKRRKLMEQQTMPNQPHQQHDLQDEDEHQDSDQQGSDRRELDPEVEEDAISEPKHGVPSDMEQSETEDPDPVSSLNEIVPLAESTSKEIDTNLFKNKKISELFKSAGGIPGLDLVDHKTINHAEGDPEPDVIDLDNEGPSRPAKVPAMSTTLQQSALKPLTADIGSRFQPSLPSSQPQKRKIPSLFDIVVEKPMLSPDLAQRNVSPVRNPSPTASRSSKADIAPAAADSHSRSISKDRDALTSPGQRPSSQLSSMSQRLPLLQSNPEESSEQPILQPFSNQQQQPPSNLPPQAADIAKALQDPNVMQLLTVALAQAQQSGGINPSNPQQTQLLQQLQQLQPLMQMQQQERNSNNQPWNNVQPQRTQSNPWQAHNQNSNINATGNSIQNRNSWGGNGNPFSRNNNNQLPLNNRGPGSGNGNNNNQLPINRGPESGNDSDGNSDMQQRNPHNPFRRSFGGRGSDDNSGGNKGGNFENNFECPADQNPFSNNNNNNGQGFFGGPVNAQPQRGGNFGGGGRFDNNRPNSIFGISLGNRNNPNNFGDHCGDDNDYYRPAQVFDYQNRSRADAIVVPPANVVDYGHRPSAVMSANSFNRDNSEFVPVKTIDYGHASNSAQNENQFQQKKFANKINRWNQDPQNYQQQTQFQGQTLSQGQAQSQGSQPQGRSQSYGHTQSHGMVQSEGQTQSRGQPLNNEASSDTLQNKGFSLKTKEQISPNIQQQKQIPIEVSKQTQKPLDDKNTESNKSAENEILDELEDDTTEYPKNKWILQNPEARRRPGPPTKRGKRNYGRYEAQEKSPPHYANSDECDEIEENFEEISDNEDLNALVETPPPTPYFKPKSRHLFPSVSNVIGKPAMVFPSMENNNTIPIDEILFKPGRLTRPKNIVIIIRGPPGSGKSHVAKLIKDKEVEMGGPTPRLLSIDDYFMIENDYEEKCPKTGRKIPKKEILYEYEKEMEDTYMQYLIKSFKKTVTDHLFDFIIVDCCNQSLRTFNEFYNAARDGNFSPFVIDMICDLEVCLDQNIHNRNADEIKNIIKNYQDCPGHYIKLDVSNLLENVVEMEDVSDLEDHFAADSEVVDLDEDDETNDSNGGGFLKSKWDTDPTTENLARLDGTSKPISKRGTATLEEYLQIDGWEPPSSSTNGKKRVRWADIEEKRAQDKMRAIGFVVGQTDWNRMMDPTSGSGALTKTKYIERLNKRR